MSARILRLGDATELVDTTARRLLQRLLDLQRSQETVHLCLTGGAVATRVYERFADLVPDSDLDPASLHLWWTDEHFAPTTDPERHSLLTLSILARTLRLTGAQTHPMPPSDGHADPDSAAYAYADELGDTVFDLCLLGVGADGHVAGLFPGHEGFEATSSLAVGVTGAPVPPPEQVSLTLTAINRSRAVWVWATGPEVASAVARSLTGDDELPASHVRGAAETLWLLDDQACAEVPRFHCQY